MHLIICYKPYIVNLQLKTWDLCISFWVLWLLWIFYKEPKTFEAKPIGTPMAISKSLTIFGGEDFIDPGFYKSTVDIIQYLSITGPNIEFTGNKLS